jgi:hypothetical protein
MGRETSPGFLRVSLEDPKKQPSKQALAGAQNTFTVLK